MSVPRRVLLQRAGAAVIGVSVGLTPPGAMLIDVGDGGLHPVEHFRQLRRVLQDNDNLFGPARLLVTVEDQIGVIRQVREAIRGHDRQELLKIHTQYVDLLGWLHQDAGNHRTAQYWLDRALESSHVDGDPESTAFILARKGQLAADMGNAAEVIDVATAALAAARPGSRVAVVAATYAGHGYALQGEATASKHSYDDAYKLLQRIEDDPSCPWARFLDMAYIDVHRARSLFTLGDHSAAAKAFRAAMTALPVEYRRDRGVYLAREALAHLGAENVDQAMVIATQALAIGAETGSGRIMAELAQLDHHLIPWSTTTCVVQFREKLDDLVASQT